MSALPVASVHPDNHMCGGAGEISYAQVNEGTVWCRVCGRIWDLVPIDNGGRVWRPDPRPPMSPAQLANIRKGRNARPRKR